MIKIENVTKKFADGTLALDDVSFEIGEGTFTLIAGANGSGKTVLMNLIAGLDEPTSGKITMDEQKSHPRVGLVFQDADSQILGETPSEDVAFGAKNMGLKKENLSECVNLALEKTGLLDKKDSNARTLSGGEKRRLAVAGILAMNCDTLIFDEPFANLDYPGVKSVCDILNQLKSEGKTVILLTHETEKILALCDRMIVLCKGKIHFDGTPKEGLAQDLEKWGIKNPLSSKQSSLENLIWL